ncbi:MAG: FTR1 family protein [Hyphomicrobiaceae bacterium]
MLRAYVRGRCRFSNGHTLMSTVFIESASIILREGLEAILVLVALAAYLSRIGAENRLTALWSGAGLAIVVSIVMAWMFETFFNGAHNDMLEGVLIFVAAALMLYVSGWLFLKQDPRAWQAYLRKETDKAVAASTGLAVAALAFFAVVREGGETILFLHTVAKTNGGWSLPLVGGIVAAGVALGVFFWVVVGGTRRLPLRAVFLVTSGFLFLMALKFIGEGLQEFQEQALVPYDMSPASDLLQRLGLNPTWEALGMQAAVIAIAGIALIASRSGGAARKTPVA